MLPKSIKTNVFLIIEKNTKTYRYENIYKMAAKFKIPKSARQNSSPTRLSFPPQPPLGIKIFFFGEGQAEQNKKGR